MPPRESIRSPKRTDIYSILLILAAVFYLAAILIAGPPWGELATDYRFWSETAGGGTTETATPPATDAGTGAPATSVPSQ